MPDGYFKLDEHPQSKPHLWATWDAKIDCAVAACGVKNVNGSTVEYMEQRPDNFCEDCRASVGEK